MFNWDKFPFNEINVHLPARPQPGNNPDDRSQDAIALAAYALIAVWLFPPWIVVVASALLGAAAGALG